MTPRHRRSSGSRTRFVSICVMTRMRTQWRLLLDACGANLGATAPDWLAARDEILRLLERPYSVNLVVRGQIAWRGLIEICGSGQGRNWAMSISKIR